MFENVNKVEFMRDCLNIEGFKKNIAYFKRNINFSIQEFDSNIEGFNL
jgi:hypothetical protein